MATTEFDVVIAGAGPVGLAAAVELGMRDVSCLLIDRADRGGHSPRAKIVNVRTREHFRRWGLADELKRRSPVGPEYLAESVFVTRLSGHLLARFRNANHFSPVRSNLYS